MKNRKLIFEVPAQKLIDGYLKRGRRGAQKKRDPVYFGILLHHLEPDGNVIGTYVCPRLFLSTDEASDYIPTFIHDIKQKYRVRMYSGHSYETTILQFIPPDKTTTNE